MHVYEECERAPCAVAVGSGGAAGSGGVRRLRLVVKGHFGAGAGVTRVYTPVSISWGAREHSAAHAQRRGKLHKCTASPSKLVAAGESTIY